jgi:hypothetical protein
LARPWVPLQAVDAEVGERSRQDMQRIQFLIWLHSGLDIGQIPLRIQSEA